MLTFPSGITDQVAKESSDSNASSHQLHDVDTGATSGGAPSAFAAHKAAPVCHTSRRQSPTEHIADTLQGPAHAENLPEPASKEELKKRAEELNK